MSAFCARCAVLVGRWAGPAAAILAVLHPIIHGTPLDQGWVDAVIQNSPALLTTRED